MEPHQQRVLTETATLDSNIEKLTAFIHSPTFATVDEAEKGRLWTQLALMEALSVTLHKRIEAFGPAKP